MLAHDVMETVLDALHKDLSIVNIHIELSLNRIMNQDTHFDVYISILTVPVSLEGHRDSFPTVWIVVSESISTALY